MIVCKSRFDYFSSSMRSVSPCSTTCIINLFSEAIFYSLAAVGKDGHFDMSDLLENNCVSLINILGESSLLLLSYSLAPYNYCQFLFVCDVCCETSFRGCVLTTYISGSSSSFAIDLQTESGCLGCFIKRNYLLSDQKLFFGVIGLGEYFRIATQPRLSDKGTSSSRKQQG